MIITILGPVQNASAKTNNFYTYSFDYFGNELQSPDAYTAEDLLLGSSLGIGDFKNPTGLFVKDSLIYIVDTDNNRIVIVDKSFQLVKIIESVIIDGAESTLLKPQDIFVADNGDMYICDTGNHRILHTDKDLNLIKIYTKPEDETILEKQDFIPKKCVVDTSGRLYLLAGNVNKGFMEFDVKGDFTAYVGANPVKATFFQVIQKRLMTKEQRARMISFVPTEYSNIAIDKDNFLYATTTTFSDGDLANNKIKPIRKLNSLGEDVLIRNGYEDPIGDVYWGTGGDISGSSKFEDITALDNDTYFVIDRIRGRVFGYDFQGNLLYAFGGVGNKMGYFLYPVAIEHMGTDLLVLDNRSAALTRFTLTEYGAMINEGLALYKEGRYEESAEYWRKVLRLNGNYDLAYIGIGRALLRQGYYKEAMKYFESKRDTRNYSKAFQEYRKQWVEDHIEWLVGGVVLLLFLPRIIKIFKKLIKGGVHKS
jgi:hypothetical protein